MFLKKLIGVSEYNSQSLFNIGCSKMILMKSPTIIDLTRKSRRHVHYVFDPAVVYDYCQLPWRTTIFVIVNRYGVWYPSAFHFIQIIFLHEANERG